MCDVNLHYSTSMDTALVLVLYAISQLICHIYNLSKHTVEKSILSCIKRVYAPKRLVFFPVIKTTPPLSLPLMCISLGSRDGSRRVTQGAMSRGSAAGREGGQNLDEYFRLPAAGAGPSNMVDPDRGRIQCQPSVRSRRTSEDMRGAPGPARGPCNKYYGSADGPAAVPTGTHRKERSNAARRWI